MDLARAKSAALMAIVSRTWSLRGYAPEVYFFILSKSAGAPGPASAHPLMPPRIAMKTKKKTVPTRKKPRAKKLGRFKPRKELVVRKFRSS